MAVGDDVAVAPVAWYPENVGERATEGKEVAASETCTYLMEDEP